jgi:glycosyltransferase involved in cell wall biosynthesis
MILDDINEWKKEFKGKLTPIFLELNLLSNEQMWRLHQTGDCFVSAHRGEGWGMPQAEAMLMGKPIISTSLGGIHDWLDEKTSWLIPYKMINIFGMGHILWYKKDYLWADIDTKELGKAMKEAFSNRKLVKDKGRKSQEFVRKYFSYEAVAKQMKEALESL